MRKLLLQIFYILIVVALISVFYVVAYFITPFIYSGLELQPPRQITPIINLVLGLLMAYLFSNLIESKMPMPRSKTLSNLIHAMGQIAQGNFNIRVIKPTLDDGQTAELIESVNKMALDLNQVENMRQEFISNVSHEIQSPLASIRGFALALRNEQLSAEERRHYLDIIDIETRRLSALSDNMLKLASLETQNMKFEPRPYRLDKQLRHLILACEPQWMDKQIDMQLFLDETYITADEDLLSQVWINLIHNSIKFTQDGGEVRVDLQQHGNQIKVRISDNGIGISEEDHPRIFERFYKADTARERSQGGSGLGLSISKKIIALHNGTITVQGTLGEGSVFIVSLPLKQGSRTTKNSSGQQL